MNAKTQELKIIAGRKSHIDFQKPRDDFTQTSKPHLFPWKEVDLYALDKCGREGRYFGIRWDSWMQIKSGKWSDVDKYFLNSGHFL